MALSHVKRRHENDTSKRDGGLFLRPQHLQHLVPTQQGFGEVDYAYCSQKPGSWGGRWHYRVQYRQVKGLFFVCHEDGGVSSLEMPKNLVGLRRHSVGLWKSVCVCVCVAS